MKETKWNARAAKHTFVVRCIKSKAGVWRQYMKVGKTLYRWDAKMQTWVGTTPTKRTDPGLLAWYKRMFQMEPQK